MLSYDENFVPMVNPEDVNPNFANCAITDGKPHSDAWCVQVGEQSPIPKSTTYKTDGPVMCYNKKENKLTPIRDFMTGAEKVNHPSHYNQGGIECIDGIAAACQGLSGEEAFCTGSAIKYLWRWKYKNGVEDLEKAKWYIDRLIKTLGEKE